VGERDPDLWFTDRPRDQSLGRRNREYVTLFAEEEAGLLLGRSAVECYRDFMRAFREEFQADMGSVVEEVRRRVRGRGRGRGRGRWWRR
jgi:beta-amylase